MTLDTIVDNLRDGVKRLELGTFLHVDQLRAEQITDPSLRNRWYYAADANGYRVKGEEVEWALTRGADSPILKDLDVAYGQLTQTESFRPSKDVSDAAFSAKDTLVTPLSQLRYRKAKDQEEWVYVEVRTADCFVNTGERYEAANETEAKIFARTGLTPSFLAELKAARIETTRTYFLNPDYVKAAVAKDVEKKDIWRASRLNYFDTGSGFGADGRDVSSRGALRGERRAL